MSNYLPASGSFISVGDLMKVQNEARGRVRARLLAQNFGMSGLGSLSGSKTRAMLAAAIAQANETQKKADAVASRVQTGALIQLQYDPNWAYDPQDPRYLFWMGTGGSGTAGDMAAIPEGYVKLSPPKVGYEHAVIWRGFGKSLAQREIDNAQATAAAAADQVAKQQQAASDAAAKQQQAVDSAQAIVDAAVGNAQIMAKQGNFDMAVNSLNDPRIVKAAAAAGSTSQLQNALSNIVDMQTKAQSTGDASADAQNALDDAVTAAKQLARKGRFDDADAMLADAQKYARALKGFSAKSELNSAQIFVDGLRQQAADQAAQAQKAQDLAAQQQANAQAAAQAAQQIASAQADQQAKVAAAQAQAAADQQNSQLQFQAMQLQAQMQMQQMALQAKMASMPQPASNTPQGGFAAGAQYGDDSGAGIPSQQLGPPPVTYGGYADPSQAATASMAPQGAITDTDVSGSIDGGGGGADFMGYMADTVSEADKATMRAQSRYRGAHAFGLKHLLIGGAAAFLLYKVAKNRHWI